jgi:hypothetical protein
MDRERIEVVLVDRLRDERGRERFAELHERGFYLKEIEFRDVSVPIAVFIKD